MLSLLFFRGGGGEVVQLRAGGGAKKRKRPPYWWEVKPKEETIQAEMAHEPFSATPSLPEPDLERIARMKKRKRMAIGLLDD